MNLVQQLINGIVLGHAYALVAIGWTLLLGVARLVNLWLELTYFAGTATPSAPRGLTGRFHGFIWADWR